MDIYRFIGSKDIARYLQEIHYKFSLPEMAFLVYVCSTVTMGEKWKAWQEMIDTLPDCQHETRHDRIESFHDFLKDHIKLQKKYIQQFHQCKGFVYFYGYQYETYQFCEGNDRIYEEKNIAFLDIDKCLEYVKRELEEWDEIKRIRIYRSIIDGDQEPLHYDREWVDFNNKFEIIEINIHGMAEEEEDIHILFEEMYFEFPTPFRHGDIVRRVGFHEPFVLDTIYYWDRAAMLEKGVSADDERLERIDKQLEKGKKHRDHSDMSAWGYSLGDNVFSRDLLCYGNLGFGGYLELEYYTEKLEGMNRVLQIISDLMKRKIHIEQAFNLYQYHSNDRRTQEWKEFLAASGLEGRSKWI